MTPEQEAMIHNTIWSSSKCLSSSPSLTGHKKPNCIKSSAHTATQTGEVAADTSHAPSGADFYPPVVSYGERKDRLLKKKFIHRFKKKLIHLSSTLG